jgi:hypothetical protein
MKSTANFAFVVFILLSHADFSQYLTTKIDLFGLLSPKLRVIRPSVEFAFSKHFSAGIVYENGKYNYGTFESTHVPEREVYNITGWGIMPELRYYPFTRKRSAPFGFFIGTHFRYRQLVEKYTGIDVLANPGSSVQYIYTNFNTKATAYNYGVHFGYKANIHIFSFETLLGFGGAKGQWETPNDRDHLDETFRTDLSDFGQSLRLEISLGITLPKVKAKQEKENTTPH